jgi:hypothetical protein
MLLTRVIESAGCPEIVTHNYSQVLQTHNNTTLLTRTVYLLVCEIPRICKKKPLIMILNFVRITEINFLSRCATIISSQMFLFHLLSYV